MATKIILHGCGGKMGRMVTEICGNDNSVEIVAGIDITGEAAGNYPVFKDIDDCDVAADVMVDFSDASAVDVMLDYCKIRKLPVVVCTTGLSKGQVEHVYRTSQHIAVLYSANMSLGINLIERVLKDTAKTLADAGFDIEIVEKHHNQKVDAPSGTALALANAINNEMGGRYEYVYDRSQEKQKRGIDEIGISSVRGGTVVGDHDVIFAGTDEVVTFSHRAYSKAVFAKGAVMAAKFLAEKVIGIWDMTDVIESRQ